MATLLSGIELLTELGVYRVVIPLLLIVAVTYGLLTRIKVFGEHKGLNMTIATAMGFIVVATTEIVDFLTLFIQYTAVAATVLIFLLIIFLFAGVDQKTIGDAFKEPIAYGTVITVFIVILFIVASQALPQIGEVTEGELEGTGVTDKALKALFHPTVLGIIVLFSIFVVTVYMITRSPEG